MANRAKLPLLTLSLSTEEEVDAVLVGLCGVELDKDSPLAPAAAALIERIVAILPPPNTPEKPRRMSPALAYPNSLAEEIHAAILNEHCLRIAYSDRKGSDTQRTIWPIEFYFVGEEDGMLLAWCETRDDFRKFRTDRIRSLETLERYPVRRQLLLAKYAAQQVDDFI